MQDRREYAHFTDEEALSMPHYRYKMVSHGLSKIFLFKVSEAGVKSRALGL